jgi:hypothetical protein
MPAPIARLIWSAAYDPCVLTVAALTPGAVVDDLFDLTRFGSRAIVARGADREHVAITDGAVRLRLDVVRGSVCAGPVMLEHRMFGALAPGYFAIALQQLASLCRMGRAAQWREPADPRLPRLIQALRVLDALADGASLRSIAAALPGDGVADWPGPGESTKSRVRRLVDLARRLEAGGPAAVLCRMI